MRPMSTKAQPGSQNRSGLPAALALVAACLLLAGCGDRTPDYSTERSDALAKDLRDRMVHTQGRT